MDKNEISGHIVLTNPYDMVKYEYSNGLVTRKNGEIKWK